MRIYNAQIYINGKFVNGGIDFDEKINEVGPSVTSGDIDLNNQYLIPGLIDIHTHAAVNVDASDGKSEDLPKLGKYYAKEGVTSFCPTTMTLKEKELTKAVRALSGYVRPKNGAKIAGINLEGPFLSRAKKGAQNEENLHLPDIDMFNRLNDASNHMIKLVTVAPEESGAIEFIKEASKVATVSIGHTACDYEQAMKAYEAGASHATHLFNGMPSLLHRAPGVIAAALDNNASVELITDGFHIHPSVIRLTSKLFNDKLCLISDSLRCAGMPDGEYELGGQPIEMINGKACLKGTDTLAGSSIHLMEGLRRTVKFGVPLEKAVLASTLSPAKAIKMDKEIGSLEKGKYADFVVLDSSLNVKAVYINGERI